MEIPAEHKGRCFYHFTHIENIESIIDNGILCTNEKKVKNIGHVDLANENIQERRSRKDVPCSPFGKIHDYVPFYFTAPNPMLLSVLNRKNIDQPFVVYIAISIEKLLQNNVLFTDKSANTEALPSFYQDPKDLDKLSWNLIDNTKWTEKNKDDLHSRMAEVLVYKNVPIDWIESFIVYNEFCKDKIEAIYKKRGLPKPKISYGYYNRKYFYFTKFFIKGKEKETLVTGPYLLRYYFNKAIKEIIDERKKRNNMSNSFSDIKDALTKIKENFCVLNELSGIYGLKTDNKMHSESVSDHTITVVSNLNDNQYYKELNEHDRNLVKLAAYFHDIGKGPKSKWTNNIQPNYPDHPADSVPMIKRILIEEFIAISDDEIKKICLLVFYHDLIGDIISKGRSKEELKKLNVNDNELNMLIAISIADASAIESQWGIKIEREASELKEEILVNDTVCVW